MTEPHDIDELASAYLDGATSPEETARVEADPALVARVEDLRVVRQALGELPLVDATQREAAIDAALAVYDDEALTAALRPAAVTALAPRRGLSPGTVRALSAAAVVLLLVLVPLLLFDGGDSGDEASFHATGDAIEGAADGGAESADDASSDSTVATPDSSGGQLNPGERDDLGRFDDLDALAVAVSARAPVPGEAGFEAPDYLFCTPIGPGLSDAFLATVAGQPVEVFVITEEGGDRSMVVRDQGTCDELAARSL